MQLKTLGLALAVSAGLVAAAGAQVVNSDSDNDLAPTGKGCGVHVSSPEEKANRKPRPPHLPPATNGIDYHNGPVMLGNVNVYFIWYGNWAGDSTVDILTDAAKTIGKTPWFNINSTYWNKLNQRPANLVTYVKSTTDNYSRGTSLSDSAI